MDILCENCIGVCARGEQRRRRIFDEETFLENWGSRSCTSEAAAEFSGLGRVGPVRCGGGPDPGVGSIARPHALFIVCMCVYVCYVYNIPMYTYESGSSIAVFDSLYFSYSSFLSTLLRFSLPTFPFHCVRVCISSHRLTKLAYYYYLNTVINS